MNKILWVLVLLCVSHIAQASPNRDFSFKYGVISDNGPIFAFAPTKFFAVAARDDLWVFTQQLELGFISDPSTPGMASPAFVSHAIGFETKTETFFGYYLLGPALISGTDSKLSSILQFTHDLGAGFKDKRGIAVDISYRHFSNAGLWPPNNGRNFIVLRLSMPWSTLFGT
ncbi:MAG: acyloxyacyl hydrolase [Xanthomonadaceae bacterium]|nr:acyloxyacyl hydrolase [Xanthomonadaceae bacterium]